MSTLDTEIKGIILNHSEDTLLQLISRLKCSGLELKEDLKYVQQGDMSDLLPVIHVLEAFGCI